MTQQAIDPIDPVEVDPGQESGVEVDPSGDIDLVEVEQLDPNGADGGLVDEGGAGALMALPAAVLLTGNAATVMGATAWQAGGAVGLASAAAVTGGSLAAGAVVRHAHRVEARRRAEAAEATGKPAGRAGKAPERPLTRAERARAVREARHAARSTGPGGAARPGAARPGTGGGGRRAAGKAGAGTGAGKGARTGGGRGRAGSGAGPMSALRSFGAGKNPAGGKSSTARTGAGRGAATGAAGGRRLGGVGAGRGAGGGSGAGRLGQLGRRAGASSAARKVAGSAPVRAGAAGLAATRRAGAAGSGAARRAGAAGTARLGKSTHAATGSPAGRKVAGLARRAGGAGRSAGAGLRRAHSAGRAGLAGARTAAGQSPIAKARAVRTALKAERARQDKETGRKVGRLARFRRAVTGAAAGLGTAVLAAGYTADRGTARWGRWAVQAIAARRAGRPAPPTPTQAGQRERERLAAVEAAAAQEHPPVAGVIEEPPAHARRPVTTTVIDPRRGAQQMGKLGLYLQDLSGQMAAAAAVYEPEGMLEWGQDMAMLEDVLANVAGVLEALERGTDGLPIEPAVKSTIGTVAALQHSCAEAAGEIHTTFRAVHADELARLENPRANEHKWDTGRNQ